MGQDFNTHSQIANVVQSAQKVLRVLGQPVENGERHFKGQVYELHGREDSLKVQTAARGIILSIQQGQVEINQLTENDLKSSLAPLPLGDVENGEKPLVWRMCLRN